MINNSLVLGIDLGTSGVRIAIINANKKAFKVIQEKLINI